MPDSSELDASDASGADLAAVSSATADVSLPCMTGLLHAPSHNHACATPCMHACMHAPLLHTEQNPTDPGACCTHAGCRRGSNWLHVAQDHAAAAAARAAGNDALHLQLQRLHHQGRDHGRAAAGLRPGLRPLRPVVRPSLRTHKPIFNSSAACVSSSIACGAACTPDAVICGLITA